MRWLLGAVLLLTAGCATPFSGPKVYDGHTVDQEHYWCAVAKDEEDIWVVPCWRIQRAL